MLPGFVDNLRPSVLANLIRFDSQQEVLLPEFTSEQPKLKEAIAAKFAVGRGTALFDAVDKGSTLLEKVSGNRAMIVMTDGSDSASKMSYPNFWKLVEARKVRLYTVGFGNEMDLLADKLGTTPRRMMEHVALATHSKSYMSETAEELKNLYEAIVAFQKRERLNWSHQLHAVIRRMTRSAAELTHTSIRCHDDGGPASRSGISLRRTIGEDDDGAGRLI